jgi:hypothetical protein
VEYLLLQRSCQWHSSVDISGSKPNPEPCAAKKFCNAEQRYVMHPLVLWSLPPSVFKWTQQVQHYAGKHTRKVKRWRHTPLRMLQLLRNETQGTAKKTLCEHRNDEGGLQEGQGGSIRLDQLGQGSSKCKRCTKREHLPWIRRHYVLRKR